MDDRRKYVRIPDNSQFSYEIISAQKIGKSATSDISQGGMRFEVNQFIPKGTNLKVKLTLSQIFFTFEVIVKVMWVRQLPYGEEYEVGVEFLDLPYNFSKVLMEYVESLLKNKK